MQINHVISPTIPVTGELSINQYDISLGGIGRSLGWRWVRAGEGPELLDCSLK